LRICAFNKGEGSICTYHREYGGDLIWQIGTGYAGCRYLDGTFNETAFASNAGEDQVKMIEIKLSQGAKPSHGGGLHGATVTKEIALIRPGRSRQDGHLSRQPSRVRQPCRIAAVREALAQLQRRQTDWLQTVHWQKE